MSSDRSDTHAANPGSALLRADQRTPWGDRLRAFIRASGTILNRFWTTQSGVFLGLLTVAFSTYASAYYARRDTNRQASEQCKSATSGWITELRLSGEIATDASIAMASGQTFGFTPFDEEMRSRNLTFTLLDGGEINAILRDEFLFRAMRTSLSTVVDARHAGDIYFVPPTGEQGFIKFARNIATEADNGVRLLSQSHQCKLLKRTNWF